MAEKGSQDGPKFKDLESIEELFGSTVLSGLARCSPLFCAAKDEKKAFRS